MLKAIKDSKWYWWIPIIWLFCIHKMSKWIFEPDSYVERTYRGLLVELLMFPTLFIILLVIFKIIQNW